MILTSFDLETYRFGPAQQAPKPVLASWSSEGGAPQLAIGLDAIASTFRVALAMGAIVGHGLAFDLAVLCAHVQDLLPVVFNALDLGRVRDTEIRQRLFEIAKGCYRGKGPAPFVPPSPEAEEEDEEFEAPDAPKEKSKGPWYGSYELAAVSARTVGGPLMRKDVWRTSFGHFDGLALEEIPEGARAYALRDAAEPLAIFRWQEAEGAKIAAYGRDGAVVDLYADEARKVRAMFSLRLWSAWGLRTDPPAVESLRRFVEAERAASRAKLQGTSQGALTAREQRALATRDPLERFLIKPDTVMWANRPDLRRVVEGTRDVEAIRARVELVYRSAGREVPRTDGGNVSWASNVLEESGDPALQELARLSSLNKVLSTDVPLLERGICEPIHTRFQIVESGRISSSPNVQNFSRDEDAGVRECFVPREGHVFAVCDYSMLEICSFGQTCFDLFGWSDFVEAINRGLDPHLDFGAAMLGISYEQAKAQLKLEKAVGWTGPTPTKDARQLAKIANFGLLADMQEETFVVYARAQRPKGVTAEDWEAKIALPEIQRLKRAWREKWRETKPFFDYCRRISRGDRRVLLPRSGRLRGNLRFTQIANTQFQGPGADVALAAAWLVTRRAYLDPGPLLGARPVNLVHDEIVAEVPRARAPEMADALRDTMIEAAHEFLPNVKIGASVALCDRYSKLAEETRAPAREGEREGRLLVAKLGQRHAKDPRTGALRFDVRGKAVLQWHVEKYETA